MTYMPWSLSLMGLSGIAAGVVGAMLPPGRRLESLLALVAGAGAGVLVLGIGLALNLVEPPSPAFERLFFAGSCVGTAVVAGVLVLLWRRTSSG